ncbi:MAG TPA: GNAT family N-acetyltransferase [Stellaceae bacterium]|nr:GNAT family N-acetyltransferase [Stellaceae bacterium]
MDCVAPGRWAEASVAGKARLPYLLPRKGFFKHSGMPSFTSVLGPVLASGSGSPRTRQALDMGTTMELIDQLPRFDSFDQTIDGTAENFLGFQARGFKIGLMHSVELDCKVDAKLLWAGMRDKTRNVIRRADERFSVDRLADPEEFVDFYIANIERRDAQNEREFERFPDLFAACTNRDAGAIFAARNEAGDLAAAIFVAWGHGAMHFLLSTRHAEKADAGAVSLLLWHAMQEAQRRQVTFDFDGVLTAGTAKFVLGFGGKLVSRHVVKRVSARYYPRMAFREFRASQRDGVETFRF